MQLFNWQPFVSINVTKNCASSTQSGNHFLTRVLNQKHCKKRIFTKMRASHFLKQRYSMFQAFALLSFGSARPFVLLSIPAITVTSCNLLACAVCLHKIRLLNCQRQNWPAKRNQQHMITVKSHHRGPTVSNMWLQVTLPSKPNFNFGLQILKSFCQVGLRRLDVSFFL